MINQSKLLKTFEDVFEVNVLESGPFSVSKVTEWATALGLQVCEDVTKANPGRMPTREERERIAEFTRLFVPLTVKLITEPSKIAKLLEEVGSMSWDDEVEIKAPEIKINSSEIEVPSCTGMVQFTQPKVKDALSRTVYSVIDAMFYGKWHDPRVPSRDEAHRRVMQWIEAHAGLSIFSKEHLSSDNFYPDDPSYRFFTIVAGAWNEAYGGYYEAIPAWPGTVSLARQFCAVLVHNLEEGGLL